MADNARNRWDWRTHALARVADSMTLEEPRVREAHRAQLALIVHALTDVMRKCTDDGQPYGRASEKYISEVAGGLERKRVRFAVEELEEIGLLVVTRRRGVSNLYVAVMPTTVPTRDDLARHHAP